MLPDTLGETSRKHVFNLCLGVGVSRFIYGNTIALPANNVCQFSLFLFEVVNYWAQQRAKMWA